MILVSGLTDDPTVGPYLRGQLLINRIDLHRPLGEWLDAVYALWAAAPHAELKEAHKVIRAHADRIAPDRDSWGVSPEHIAQMGSLGVVVD